MDFALSEEQREIKIMARKFAENEFPPVARKCDKEEKMDLALLEKARGVGLAGGIIPEEYGGPGLNIFENALIAEEFWRVDPGLGQAILSIAFGAAILIDYASDEQKKQYLTPLVAEKGILATAITEADAGSDVTRARTSAVKNAGEYIINGTKMFITNGTLANHIIVFCKTHPDEISPHKQYSSLMVPTDSKGFESNKLKDKLGIRASDTAEISFEDVHIPEQNLIGNEQEAFKHILHLFNRERITVCAQAVGLAQGALEQAIRFISDRVQFGKPLSSNQATRFKIAEMATQIEASRALYYRAAWLIDSGKEDHAFVAMAKWFCAQNAVTVVQEALQMHGGYGFFNEYDIARFYRDAKIVEIYEGTKEMEKILIANTLLGKPEEKSN